MSRFSSHAASQSRARRPSSGSVGVGPGASSPARRRTRPSGQGQFQSLADGCDHRRTALGRAAVRSSLFRQRDGGRHLYRRPPDGGETQACANQTRANAPKRRSAPCFRRSRRLHEGLRQQCVRSGRSFGKTFQNLCKNLFQNDYKSHRFLSQPAFPFFQVCLAELSRAIGKGCMAAPHGRRKGSAKAGHAFRKMLKMLRRGPMMRRCRLLVSPDATLSGEVVRVGLRRPTARPTIGCPGSSAG